MVQFLDTSGDRVILYVGIIGVVNFKIQLQDNISQYRYHKHDIILGCVSFIFDSHIYF